MKKIEKYLIAQNKRVENGGLYILITRKYKILVEITDLLPNDPNAIKEIIYFEGPNTHLKKHQLTIIDYPENTPIEKLEKELARCAQWYKQYLIWQNN